MSKRAKWSVIDMSQNDRIVSEHESKEEAVEASRALNDPRYIAACPWDGLKSAPTYQRAWTEVDYCS